MLDSDKEIKLAYSVQRLAYRKDEAKKIGGVLHTPRVTYYMFTNYCILFACMSKEFTLQP